MNLLRRVEPPRAPIGFVGSVMARTRPTFRPREVGQRSPRFLDWLLRPLAVKVPVWAAAIVLMAGLAVLLFDRTPELRQAARVDGPAQRAVSEAPSAPPPAVERADPPAEKVAEVPAPSRGEVPPQKVAEAPPAPPAESPRPAPAAPVAKAPATPEPEPPRAVAEAPSAPLVAPLPLPGSSAAQSAGAPRERAERGRLQAARPPARADAAASRLEVRDRSAAVAGLRELLTRIGGAEIGRRQEGADLVVEVLVPEARVDELVRGLSGLGTWRPSGAGERVMLETPHRHVTIRLVE